MHHSAAAIVHRAIARVIARYRHTDCCISQSSDRFAFGTSELKGFTLLYITEKLRQQSWGSLLRVSDDLHTLFRRGD